MCGASTQFIMTTFSAVSEVVANIYDTDATIVNTCVTVFFAAYIIVINPGVWFLEKYGTSITVSLIYFQTLFN